MTAPSGSATLGPPAFDFVGREAECQRLVARWEAAADGRGGVMLIVGEPGMGKSALVETVTHRLAASVLAPRIVWGRAWEAGGAPPFWPWTQALRALARAGWEPPEPLEPLVGGRATERSSLPPDDARFALLESATEGLCDAAGAHPTLVVLEDLHAADASSVALLEVVADAARSVPLLVLATARERELRRGHGAAHERLRRITTDVRLGPLTTDEVTTYCAVHGLGDGERLRTLSEGHPLYLRELVSLSSELPGAVSLPPTIEETLRSRLMHLSPGTRTTVCVAAVWGREVADDDLEAVRPRADGSLEAQLQEARDARILLPVEGDGGRVRRFGHILQREVAYQLLEAPARWHHAVAERLRERDEPPWIEIAHHLRAAGEIDRYEAVDAAADEAWRGLAFEEAMALRAEALELAPAESRAEASIALAEAQLAVGELEAGRATCAEAAAEAEARADAPAHARASLAYGSVILAGAIDDRLGELLAKSLELLNARADAEDRGALALRAQVLARLAATELPSDDPDLEGTFERARDAIALARRVDRPRVLLHTMRSAIAALMDIGDPLERLELNTEYVALAERTGEPVEVWRGWTRSVFDAWELGDFERAETCIGRAGDAADSMGLGAYRWSAVALRAGQADLRGDLAEGARLTDEAAAIAEAGRGSDPMPARVLAFQRFLRARLRGDPGAFATCLAELRACLSVDGWVRRWVVPLFEAELRSLRGEVAPLEPELVDYVVRFGDRGLLEWATAGLVHCDRESSARAIATLEPHAERWGASGFVGHSVDGPVARHLGRLRAARGDLEAARRWLEKAVSDCEAAGAQPQRAWSLWELAAVEAALGDDGEAGTHRREARELAEALGLTLTDPVFDAAPGPSHLSSTPSHEPPFTLEREGEVWRVHHGAGSFLLKDTRGVQLLDRLRAEPGRELHVLDLAGAASMLPAASDAGPVIDDEAKRAYRQRARELRAMLEEAEANGELGRTERARHELEALEDELVRALGLGGRERRAGSVSERARVNVQRRLKDAVERVAQHDGALAKHLEQTLRTGTYCIYDP